MNAIPPRASAVRMIFIALISLLLIAWLDYVTGNEVSIFILYFIPIALLAWKVNEITGIVMAFASALATFLVDLLAHHVYSAPMYMFWNTAILLVTFVLAAMTVSYIRLGMERQRQLNTQLEQTLAQVKQLSGLLPICASCKRIRNDSGRWQQMEEYIRAHSEAEFSHGLCPECMKRMYPGYSAGEERQK